MTVIPATERRGVKPRRAAWFDWMVLPTVAILGFVIGYPIVRTFILSTQHYKVLSGLPATGAGFSNFQQLYHDPVFWQSLRNTAVYTFGSVVVAVLLGLVLALLTEHMAGPWRYIRTVMLTPWAVPLIVVAFLFRYMFDQDSGVVNDLLRQLGLIHANVHWLTSSTWAMPTVMLANIWTAVPFFFLVFTAGLTSVPNDVVEAARVDRAGPWVMVGRIKLPYLIGPAMIAVLIMVINNFNDFAKIWAMTGGGPAYSTTTLVVYVYQLAFSSFNMGYSSAIGVVWLLLLMIFAVFYVRLLQRAAR